jgi:DNA-binding GntR family transcriptional regulator
MKGGATRTDSLVSALADNIVSGDLPPGTSLDETQLAQRFGVSRTPVREAIRQLATMGLVEARPHRGSIVARPAATRLRDMFFVMAELEAICVGLCARTMTRDQRRDLEAFHRDMGALVRAGDVEGYGRANLAFHGRLYDGARNSYLTELAAATRRRLAPFRSAQLEAADRLHKSYEEHGAIVTAILRGDGARAAAAIRQHLEITEQTWLELTEGSTRAGGRLTGPERRVVSATATGRSPV